jgi:hypothetical protein
LSIFITQIASYKFKRNIWKILADSLSDFLVVILQDSTEFVYSIAYIRLSNDSDEVQYLDIPFEGNWLPALLYQNKLIFQSYPDTRLPSSEQIWVYDLLVKRTLFHLPTHSFHSILNDRLICYRLVDSELKYEIIDWQDGTLIENLIHSPVQMQTIEDDRLVFPEAYPEDSSQFVTVRNFLSNRFQIQPVKVLDYLEYREMVFISYFLPKKLSKMDGFSNYLLILDTNAQILLNECINSFGKGITFDSFLIVNQKLIFLKNRNELIVYAL